MSACISCSPERNIVEAAANGAVTSAKLVAGVIVNLIAFVAILAFLNATLSYLGGRVGYPQLSFQASYLQAGTGLSTMVQV